MQIQNQPVERSGERRSVGGRRVTVLAALLAVSAALALAAEAGASASPQSQFPQRVDPGEVVVVSNGATVYNAAAKPVVVDESVELQLGVLITFDSFNFTVEGGACRARTVQMSCLAPAGAQLVIGEADGPGRSPDRTIAPGGTLPFEYGRAIINERAISATVFDYPDVYDWTNERWLNQVVIIAAGASPRVSGGANCRPLPLRYSADWDCILPLGSTVTLADAP